MKVITEPLEQRQLRLTIEVDEDRTQKAMRRVARQIARQVNIPVSARGRPRMNSSCSALVRRLCVRRLPRP